MLRNDATITVPGIVIQVWYALLWLDDMNVFVTLDTCECCWRHVSCQVGQVPPNRTYQCSHARLYGKALARSIGGFSYAYHQRGKAMRTCYPDQVGGDSFESWVMLLRRSSTRTVWSGVRRTQGLPRTWLMEYVGDTVREACGRGVSLE